MASLGNPFVPEVTWFRNSSEFSYLANYFRENKCYTKLPEGTVDYKEFWKEVKKYCLEGFTNSKGIYITGKHFFYLNFVQIDKQEDEDTNPNKSKKPGRKRKSKDFPRFVDLDYDYFHMLNYCEEYQKSELAVKGRRQGWSYKAGSVVAHEFTFLKDSKCIISAYLEKYSANTMKFVLDNLNFLAKNTPFGHIRNPDTKDFIQARYMKDLGGIKVWEGYNSSVASLTFNNSYESAVGLSADKFIIDEAGLFPSIIEAYGYTEPLIKDGNEYTGMALIFGSSGEIEKAEPFMKMFMNPDTYNFLKFYDPNGKETAYFSPAYRGRWGKCRDPKSKYYNQELVDKDGNSMEQAAIDDILWEREILKKGSDRQRYHKFITQYPIKWEEAFLRAGQTIFPTIEIADWLSVLETNKNVAPPVTVDLYFDSENKIQYRLNDDEYITEFPLQRQDKKGAIAIFEFPEYTNGEIPYGQYVASNDSYDHDQAKTSSSLGSFFVYKRFYRADKTHDILVAEYTGRPEMADDFYENCRRLCIFYNAKCLYENQLKGLKAYFEKKHSLHYLYNTPNILKDIIKDSVVTRTYGIHMNQTIKRQLEIYTKQWLLTERTESDGKKILNLHTIKSPALLKELLLYDGELNTDRVIAFMLAILQCKEMENIAVTEESTNYKPDPFWSKPLYSKNNNINNFML